MYRRHVGAQLPVLLHCPRGARGGSCNVHDASSVGDFRDPVRVMTSRRGRIGTAYGGGGDGGSSNSSAEASERLCCVGDANIYEYSSFHDPQTVQHVSDHPLPSFCSRHLLRRGSTCQHTGCLASVLGPIHRADIDWLGARSDVLKGRSVRLQCPPHVRHAPSPGNDHPGS
ncbi:hypothetical protein BC628DRAFT_189429 [Trametes gibbosa]|nr:hypothetical protein BC628DRAFT_189429 [Trametes gibbosa]